MARGIRLACGVRCGLCSDRSWELTVLYADGEAVPERIACLGRVVRPSLSMPCTTSGLNEVAGGVFYVPKLPTTWPELPSNDQPTARIVLHAA